MKCAESRNFRLYGSMGCHRRPLRKKERRKKKEEEERKQYKNTTSRSSFAARALKKVNYSVFHLRSQDTFNFGRRLAPGYGSKGHANLAKRNTLWHNIPPFWKGSVYVKARDVPWIIKSLYFTAMYKIHQDSVIKTDQIKAWKVTHHAP